MKQHFLMAAAFMSAIGFAGVSWSAEQADAAAAKETPAFTLLEHFSKAKFAPAPNLPSCISMVPMQGDPGSGPSTLMVKMEGGCTTSRHWHTANEEMTMLQGTAKVEVEGQGTYEAPTGSYMLLKGGTKHRFQCVSTEACILTDSADAAFDVNEVDEAGNSLK